MRVKNTSVGGVFVEDFGVVLPGKLAVVPDSEAVDSLIKQGVLQEEAEAPKGKSSNKQKEGDS